MEDSKTEITAGPACEENYGQINYHTIEGTVNEKMVSEFMAILNDKECRHHHIFFNSEGGDIYNGLTIIGMVNNFNEQPHQRCLLIFNWISFSCSFKIMFTLRPESVRYIPGEVVGMVHLNGVRIRFNQMGEPSSIDEKSQLDSLMSSADAKFKWLKRIGLTPKEIKKVKKGKDVFLHGDRMTQLCYKNGIKEYGK